MKKIRSIAKKELINLVFNPTGYVFAAILVIVSNWLFFSDLFVGGRADLRPFWSIYGFLLTLFIPAITMGLIADEKKNGNWEILLSLPISERELVWGKFLGVAIYVAGCQLLCLPTIISVYLLGRPDSGLVWGGFLGTVVLGWAGIALGIWTSSWSSVNIVGFIGASVILLLNNLIASEAVLTRVPRVLGRIVEFTSLSWRSEQMGQGLVEIGNLVFFLSWISFFLLLSIIGVRRKNR